MPETHNPGRTFVNDELLATLFGAVGPPPPTPSQQPPDEPAPEAESAPSTAEGETGVEEPQQEQEVPAQGETAESQAAAGQACFRQERYEEAANCYRKVLELEPRNRGAHFNLALCMEKLSRHQEACEAFGQAVKLDAEHWQSRLGLAVCLLHLGRPREALGEFEAVFRREAKDGQALFGKAVALHQLGREEQAMELYEALWKSQPESVELLSNMVAATAGKNPNRCKELATRLLDLCPNSRTGLGALAALSWAAKDYEAAAQYSALLVDLVPGSYELWFNVGVACHAAKRLELACDAYREALRVRPAGREAQENMSLALEQLGHARTQQLR